MVTQTAKEETITPNPSYPKCWKRDATQELYWQLKASHDITNPETGEEISKAALTSGYTEQQIASLEIKNLSTVSE